MKNAGSKSSFLLKILTVFNLFTLIIQLYSMGALGGTSGFPLLAFAVPVLTVFNLIFFIFWTLRLSRSAFLFIGMLFLSYEELGLLYQLENKGIATAEGLKIMSYNVRSFNRYQWLKDKAIAEEIENFVESHELDVICFQEFALTEAPKLASFPYQVFKPYTPKGATGTCIISKYPLMNTRAIAFENSQNGGMQADILWKGDTIRVYNLHLESFRLDQNDTLLSSNYSEKLRKKLNSVVEIQKKQVATFNLQTSQHSYPEIICADLNNNAFSAPYQTLKKDRIDSFTEQGSGLGATYNFLMLPLRIDFIFNSPDLKVTDFKTYRVKLSDHKPISAKLTKKF